MQHFDLAVIGSGSGNSLIDERFDGLEVALVERDPTFGGTCLNRGCIPTKMYVHPADLASAYEDAGKLGVTLQRGQADWNAMRDRIFTRLDAISAGGKQWRRQNANVTVFDGEASFVDAHTLRIGDTQIEADQIVIATGSRPRTLDVPCAEGLHERIHTSDTIMRIDQLPDRLVIVGGGYIAAEFAHIFTSFGVEVTVLHRSETLLRGADEDISAAFGEALAQRVNLRLNQQVSSFEPGPAGDVAVVATDVNGVEYEYLTDMVLVAVGRERNVEALHLDAAGVERRPDGGVRVDAHQRTSVPHIWAIGDVSSDYLLKHVANHEMRTVQHNLLHPDNLISSDHRYVPNAVFSKPQIAYVGATEQQLHEWGHPYVKKVQAYGDVAYGWAMEDDSHFVKLLADPTSWHLLGAHIIGPEASTLIQPLIQTMSFGLPVDQMARGQYWIHPALTEVVENALLGLLEAKTPAELSRG
ncbi:mycothione reductase [uncultured Tessaracoccus sp.]|uniref:mycothione reductase n=1 Tax=uncultured Tessaracoccus sp. TaxID=905023 RepID=UPI002614772B|nr:mycothione reductase [uncultured Tessaracoccus sp.]